MQKEEILNQMDTRINLDREDDIINSMKENYYQASEEIRNICGIPRKPDSGLELIKKQTIFASLPELK
jgi:hypothetical protein